MSSEAVDARNIDWRWYQPWVALAVFSALLNVAWEMAAMSFYEAPAASPIGVGITMCLMATLGDVGITLGSYAVATAIAPRRWLVRHTAAPMAMYLGGGIAATIALEYVNVYRLQRGSYAYGMPTVAGIGALPLVQWGVLPPIVLWLARWYLRER